MQIIGVIGFIGSGKNTVGDMLVESHGFSRDNFARSMKDACALMFGWDRSLLEGDTEESRVFREKVDPFWTKSLGYEVTPRLMMQYLGTEAGREVFGEDLWVASCGKRITEAQKNVVITDVRFPNEIQYLRSLGGHIVLVQRGTNPDWFEQALDYNNASPEAKKEMPIPPVHYSEWAWIGQEIDFIIENDTTLQDLKYRVAGLVSLLTKTKL